MKRLALTAFLALCFLHNHATAQEAGPDRPAAETDEKGPIERIREDAKRSTDPDVQPPGFGQEPDEEPRNFRVRVETAFIGGFLETSYRHGKVGRSNRIFPQNDLDVPRYTPGGYGQIVVKLHRFFAIGASYLHMGVEGSRTTVRKDLRLGSLPTEIPPNSRASGRIELQQVAGTIRLVAADDAEFRAEFYLGFVWTGFRLGVHPSSPFPPGPYPGGGVSVGTSHRNEAYLLPALGTFFVWNVHDRVGLYVDQMSSYFSLNRFGSISSLLRFGVRLRVVGGLEVVLGGFLVSGQIYEARDRIGPRRSPGHEYAQARWLGGGPDVGLSFTY